MNKESKENDVSIKNFYDVFIFILITFKFSGRYGGHGFR